MATAVPAVSVTVDDRNTKYAFVTVGTTAFDRLVESVSSNNILKVLEKLGFQHVIFQIGRGDFVPTVSQVDNISTEYYRYKDTIAADIQKADLVISHAEYYRYKDTIAADIQKADLVISHAGAGSCLEILEAKKPLLVVINDELMNNHQLELARKLQSDGHLSYCTCNNLEDTLCKTNLSSLRTLEPAKPDKFSSFMDRVMGVS